jgi:hypothetical protein
MNTNRERKIIHEDPLRDRKVNWNIKSEILRVLIRYAKREEKEKEKGKDKEKEKKKKTQQMISRYYEETEEFCDNVHWSSSTPKKCNADSSVVIFSHALCFWWNSFQRPCEYSEEL